MKFHKITSDYWTYCMYLGSYVINNKKYDLGVFIDYTMPKGYEYQIAVVYDIYDDGNPQYISAHEDLLQWSLTNTQENYQDFYKSVLNHFNENRYGHREYLIITAFLFKQTKKILNEKHSIK